MGRRIGRRAEDHWVVSCTDCPNRLGHPRGYKTKKDCQDWWREHAREHHAKTVGAESS